MARLRYPRDRIIMPPMVSGRVVGYALSTFLALIVFFLVTSYESNTVPKVLFTSPSDIPHYIVQKLDAILVLGGGTPKAIDDPPFYVQERCDDAIEVVSFRSSGTSPLPILCLSAGTVHVPQALSEDGLPIWESTACAAYLEKKDVQVPIFVETASYDTIGNAYFTRTTHTDVNGWRNLLVITNEFHMERTRAIYDWIFSLNDSDYKLYYLESPNTGVSQEALDARQEKEASSLKQIQQYKKQYRTLKDVWEFMNTKHALYTASMLVERAKGKQSSEVSDVVKTLYGGD